MEGESCREAPWCALSFLSLFFSRTLLSLSSLFLSFSSLSSLSFSLSLFDRHSFSTVSQFRFTLHRRLHRRASYSSNDFLLMSKYETQPQEVFFLFLFLPLFFCKIYFENAHIYNKDFLRCANSARVHACENIWTRKHTSHVSRLMFIFIFSKKDVKCMCQLKKSSYSSFIFFLSTSHLLSIFLLSSSYLPSIHFLSSLFLSFSLH